MSHEPRRTLGRFVSRAALASSAALAAGCGAEPPLSAPPPVAPARVAEVTPAPASPPENPGGMWRPEQLAEHGDRLRALGLELDPAALTDPTRAPLASVVSLGGCSASFVSKDGLVVTNHHCVQGALQYNSTPEANLLKDGHVARTRGDERWAGPTARVYVTRSFRDVTAEVRAGLEAAPSDLARHDLVEARTKELVSRCEKDRAEVRCNVASYNGGAEHVLVEQLEIRDVRLVYAPAEGVGNFGGEIDNWRWPRHSGDFSFYRAYVGPDGKPADHGEKNVPYQPPHHLKLATAPLAEGDLVFVAGYPGVTNRMRTEAEVDEAVTWSYPQRIKLAEEYLALLDELGKKNAELTIKANWLIRGLGNALTNYRGMLDGLVKGGLAADKARDEKALAVHLASDKGLEKSHGAVLEEMQAALAERAKRRAQDAALVEPARFVKLVGAANRIVRMAEERARPDAARDPAYQERNWARLEQELRSMQKAYDPTLDRALLELGLRRAARLPAAERPASLAAIVGTGEPTDAAIEAAVRRLYATTKLGDEATRVKLLKTGTTASLKTSADPLVRLAVALRPHLKELEDREKAFEGRMSLLRPRYYQALRAASPGPIAPDANGTLRVTYGTVRGYSPKPGAPVYRPFTALGEIAGKHTGEVPFDAPRRLLEASKARKHGPYVDAKLGDVPVNFLADLDITGGNSGSATLNARGELVGLVFDGNYESMASDWLFQPPITRSIHVDLRYVLWMMDAVDGADHLLVEMGQKPAID